MAQWAGKLSHYGAFSMCELLCGNTSMQHWPSLKQLRPMFWVSREQERQLVVSDQSSMIETGFFCGLERGRDFWQAGL